jgi:hypothetical protein
VIILKGLGILWILLGLWWILRPQGVKKRLGKQFRRTLRTVLFLVLVASGGLLISASKYLDGMMAAGVVVVGIVAIVKALLFVRSKSSDVVLSWWEERPLWVYRMAGVGVLLAGVALEWWAGKK